MVEQLTAVSAIVPSFLFLWYFHSRDTYPEPPKMIWTTFILGMLTVVPVILVSVPLGSVLDGIRSPYLRKALEALLLASLPEETFKFAVLFLYAARCRAFDEPMDGVVYGVAASLGFATLENVLYVSGGGMATALMRAFTAIPCHAVLGVIMGSFVGRAVFRRGRRLPLLAAGLAVPVLLHALYDFPLFALREMRAMPSGEGRGVVFAGLIALFLAILIGGLLWALRMVHRLRGEQLERRLAAPLPAPALPAAAGRGGDGAPRRGTPQCGTPQRGKLAHGASISSARGWVYVLAGAILASVGGSVLLGVALAVLGGMEGTPNLGLAVFIVLSGGGFLLWLGGSIFVKGIGARNRQHAGGEGIDGEA